MTTTRELIDQLDSSWAALQAAQPRVEAGAPWPVSGKFDNAPEAYWFPPEVLAHVSELLARWLDVVNTVLAGSPEPVPFGTAGPNPARLAGIERNRHLPIRDLYVLIGTGIVAMRARIAGLSDADLARRGTHASKGETTVGEILQGSVTGHLEEHARQIESLLAAAGH